MCGGLVRWRALRSDGVSPDSSVHMRAFEPQGRIDQYFVVGSGLKTGETIVYEGLQSIRDSARIHPTPMRGKPVAAVASETPRQHP